MINPLLLFRSVVVLGALLVAACGESRTPEAPVDIHPGQVVEGTDKFGTFFTYTPTTLPQQPEILVIVHGTPFKDETEAWNAEYYIRSWVEFSEEHGFVLIVPVFNQEDFSSRFGDHALSGYRGLFGRKINADAWLLRLVQGHQQALGISPDPFYLYGHSAGGQFTSRFLVTHPDVIKKAVITSAATYPQPNEEISWPFGMGELHTEIEWDSETMTRVDIMPDLQKWLAATQISLTVFVGLNDTTELPEDLIPGQKGRDRITIAGNWVEDMAAFAEANGVESHFKFSIIPAIGHSMSGLITYSQQALLE